MNFRTIVFTTLFLPLLSACLLAVASPEPPVLLSTQAPVLVPTEAATEPPPATQGPVSEPTFMPGTAGWVEYRDPRYGYGLALPCYWTVTPTPMEGTFATMSARSYSDEFFAAHSDRGVWTGDAWPAGAYKLDAVIFEASILRSACRTPSTTPMPPTRMSRSWFRWRKRPMIATWAI